MNSVPRPYPLSVSDALAAEGIESVVQAAHEARLRAHAPYSHFQVGAALLCEGGEIFLGCNVENVSYSLTICAERVAAASAIVAKRHRWTAIVIVSRGGVAPCGACRQFLAEFGNDLRIITVDADTACRREHRLSSLLPHAMERSALDQPTSQPKHTGGSGQ